MKNKTKSRILAGIATFLVFGFFIMVYLDTSEEFDYRNDYCESKGYDGYKDEDILGLTNKFRCGKKVSKEVGYEWEYSGIIEDNS